MKYMMFMIPAVYQPGTPADKRAGENFAPPADAVAEMMKYNEELAKAGVLRGLDGLHPLSMGARVAFKGGRTVVTDGPYVEAKEVVGGYWLIEVDSKEEALNWAKRCPAMKGDTGDTIEVRQIFDMSEFPEDVRKAAESSIIDSELEHHRSY